MFLKILGVQTFLMIEVFLQIQILSLNCLSRVLIFFQYGMAVEIKGWGLDNKKM